MFRISNKKAIEAHLVIILVFSLIMTSLLILILGSVYGEEHEDCKLVDFEIASMCKKGSSVDFTLNNNAKKAMFFKLNGVKSAEYVLLSGDLGKMFSANTNEDTTVKILPYINSGNKIYECKGKVQKINSEVLLSC